jgi:hypothetical protein
MHGDGMALTRGRHIDCCCNRNTESEEAAGQGADVAPWKPQFNALI